MRKNTNPLDLVVFAHGMANFRYNLGTKAEQERLLGECIDRRHGFLGAFEDSGNYAFVSCLGVGALRQAVLSALNTKYDVADVVVVARSSCAAALLEVEHAAGERHHDDFDRSDYSVRQPSGLWRLGLVLVGVSSVLDEETWIRILAFEHERVRFLSSRAGVIGVLKYDQGKRIPWGEPAGVVADGLTKLLGGQVSGLVATGRSARTVRGVLRLFEHSDEGPVRPPAAPMRERADPDADEVSRRQSTTGGLMSEGGRQESFDEIEHRLRGHSGLRKAGGTMIDAFVTLAQEVWNGSQRQVIARPAGHRENFIPFSRVGTRQNLADTIKFRPGAIEFGLKLSEGELDRVDRNRRTEPLENRAGRFSSYTRRFVLKNPADVPFLKTLILACVRRGRRPEPSSSKTAEAELDFGFVQSDDLRKVLRSYWREAKATEKNGSWTSSTILYGSVVEGMLVAALNREGQRAGQEWLRLKRQRGLPGKRFDRGDRIEAVPPAGDLSFDVLVKVASSLRLLSDGMVKHCDGLRYTRNLIHAARAAKDPKEEVTEVKAKTARAIVRECHDDLAKRLESR